MRIHPLCTFFTIGSTAFSANALRGGEKERRLSPECTINQIAFLQIPDEAPITGGDEELGCDDGSGTFVPLSVDKGQAASIREMAASGALVFGTSKININGASSNGKGGITLPPGVPISVVGNTPWGDRELRDTGRELQTGTGDKYFILFRVTDINGKVYGHSATTMSANMFGTNNQDSMNLKSQMTACSQGKYTIIPGCKGFDCSALESAPGVIDITIPVSFSDMKFCIIITYVYSLTIIRLLIDHISF